MTSAAEKMERVAVRIERATDGINWLAGKIWRAFIAVAILGPAVRGFQSAMEQSVFLLGQNVSWLSIFYCVLMAVGAADVLIRGPRSWILVRVA